jgi:hypothetical protein
VVGANDGVRVGVADGSSVGRADLGAPAHTREPEPVCGQGTWGGAGWSG